MTEEDLRTKIIFTWLKDLGFKNEHLYFEYSFKINLGKYTYKVQPTTNTKQSLAYPRTDILVKNDNGDNLLIIEVKAPGHTLNDSDELQAISYARLLPQIAPFTILTNGKETRIFDSVTCDIINGSHIPFNHAYVNNGFKVTTPAYSFYDEALVLFIGLSIENLLTFCNFQVTESMSLLKSDDIYGGKKYIPSLFINREKEQKQLESLIAKEENKLLFVTGSPQHGKTSFICNFVDSLLSKNIPCIFYPAINIQKSLLDELNSDLQWMFSELTSIQNIFIHKLEKILARADTRLFIFIDGLNESSLEFIATLNKDFSKLKNLRVTFILSFTNTTAKRLFLDNVNNVTELANYLSLSEKHLKALEIDPKHTNDKIINIPPYSNEEATEALTLYSKSYNVKTLKTALYHDPFLLRIIMIYHTDKEFDGNINEEKFLKFYIKEKIKRTKNFDDLVIDSFLEDISKDIFLQDAPIPMKNILSYQMRITNIDPLYESALLSKTYKDNDTYLEFYNEREQCYYISYTREWNKKFQTYNSFFQEVKNINGNNAVKLALSWYLKINPFVIKEYWEKLFTNELYAVLLIFLKSFREFLHHHEIRLIEWVFNFMIKALTSKDEIVLVESLKLIKYFPHLKDEFLDKNSDIFLERILFNTDDELEYDPFDLITYDTLKEMHESEQTHNYFDSEISLKLKNIILEKQSAKALEALAYCSPFILFEFLDNHDNNMSLNQLVNNSKNLYYIMTKELEIYYDGYLGCPGLFDSDDSEKLKKEYEKNLKYYNKFSKCYSRNVILINYFKNMLKIIRNKLKILDEDNILHLESPDQTHFQFD